MADENKGLEGKTEEPPDFIKIATTSFSLTSEEVRFFESITQHLGLPYDQVIKEISDSGRYSASDMLSKIRGLANRGVISPYSGSLSDVCRLTNAAEIILRRYMVEIRI